MPDTYVEGAGGEELVFQFGNDADPIAYTEECTINADRSVEFTSEVTTSVRKNCTNPSKPGRQKRRIKSTDLRFTGAGTASMASARRLIQAQLDGKIIPGKLIQDATNGWTITGKWTIDSISLGGVDLEDQTFSITLSIADPDYTFVPAA